MIQNNKRFGISMEDKMFGHVSGKGLQLLLTAVFFLFAVFPAAALKLQTGDLVFQERGGEQGAAVKAATGSRFDHVGMILIRNGKPYVYEAVGPVIITPFSRWKKLGLKDYYEVLRLKDTSGKEVFSPARLDPVVKKYLKRPYDFVFQWDEETIYCSELVWKVYQQAAGIRLCEPREFGSYNFDDPRVAALLKKRLGDRFPEHEPVVSPQDLYESALLYRVK